jgi:predicted ATPase
MRIDRLEIKSAWKNLQGVIVDFDEREPITVLIGRNGAAKSNVLEALITIFSKIALREQADFAYTVNYVIKDRRVAITADLAKMPKATIDGIAVTLDELRDLWTPHFVVGYYSGTSDRFQKLFEPHDLQARDAGKAAPHKSGSPEHALSLRRFTYARPEHGLFSLLAFYYKIDSKLEAFLRRTLRITGFDSTLITVHKPSWGSDDVDDFWGATGAVRYLLEILRDHAIAPFHHKVRVKTDFASKGTLTEMWHLFLPDLQSLSAVAAIYGDDPTSLFQALDSMRLSKLLGEFRVRVKVEGAGGAIHTRQMSEGEQQLLTVLGLMRFTRQQSSLYMLDEPDTHLNPAWEVDYLEMLRSVAQIDRNSHTIIATHDPLLVAGLCREQICVMSRGKEGKITTDHPEASPRGRGVAAVLTSPLYGLESQLDTFSLRVLKRIYETSFDEDTTRRARNLKRLRKLVPGVEPDESSPDPYRNIARLAYRLARTFPLDDSDRKSEIVEALAKQLYTQAKENA